MRIGLVALVGALTAACGRAPSRVDPAGDAGARSASAAECVPTTAEKIGVPFVRVCPRAKVDSAEPAKPFWISQVPLGCAPGSHRTVACPPIVALLSPPSELPDLRAPSPGLAAVVDAYTAHKICTMRFAGRLPTRAERAQAVAALGLATVVVTEPRGGHPVHVRALAEWVTAVPCDHPTDLGPECKEDRFPSDAISQVPWAMLARCAARPVKTSPLSVIDVGGECSAERVGDAKLELPCLIRGLAYASSGPPPSPVVGFELSCEPPTDAIERPAQDRDDVAAFRCVLPEWL